MLKLLSLLIAFQFMQENTVIYDFQNTDDISDWFILDDGVMGGQSSGNLKKTEQGHALYYGTISLENNGGFSSVRLSLNDLSLKQKKYIVLRVNGDGKKYQCRIKNKSEPYASYRYDFKTSGDWELIKLPLSEFEPYYRGRQLEMPDFNHTSIEEIGILIGNKREESFQLKIDFLATE